MGGRARRSKRQSAASWSATPRRRPAPVFFVDRDLGRYTVPTALRAVGAVVEVHADHFRDDESDDVWLPAVGAKGWIVITKDKAIRHRDTELEALKRAGVAAFVLTKGGTGPENGADARSRLIRLLGVHVVDVQSSVTLLEAHAGSYLVARPGDAARARRELERTQASARELDSSLRNLGEDAAATVLDGLTLNGDDHDPRFIGKLQEGLRLLKEAIDTAEEEAPPLAPGRPRERARGWLARQIRVTLEEQGLDPRSRRGARALAKALRIVLASVGDPVPADMRPLLNEARRG